MCCHLGASLVVLSFAWIGHAGQVKGYCVTPLFVLILHLLGVTYWLDTLWPLHQLARGDDLQHRCPHAGLGGPEQTALDARLLNGDLTAQAELKRSIHFEMALASLILLVTTTFTTLAGPATIQSLR